MFQQPFRPPFFFLQGIEYTPIIVIISFPYLQNNTASVQSKSNKNLKSLKAKHGVQMISGPDCRKTPGLFSATPQKSMEGWGGCGAILYPHPEKHRPFFRYPSPFLIQQPTAPDHPGDRQAPPSPRGPKQPPAPPELPIGTQKEHSKPPNHCNNKENC